MKNVEDRSRCSAHLIFTIRHSAFLCAATLLGITGCATTPGPPDFVYFPKPPNPPRAVHLKSFNRLADLVPVRRTIVNVIRGESISPSVGTPGGVAYRDGHLYICDTQNNVVEAWDLRTGHSRRLGARSGSSLGKPVDVAVDVRRRAFVADTGRAAVVCLGPDGSTCGDFRPPDRDEYRPVAVAVDDGAGRLYVADIAAHRIDVFSMSGGDSSDGALKYERSFGGTGSETGRMYFPMGVAVGADGGVLVSDMMNARMQLFDQDGHATGSFGQAGNRYGDLGKPRHLAVGPDGVVFIADADFRHVHLFNEAGQLLMLLGGPADEPGGTPLPVSVAVAEDLPECLREWVPADFTARYFVFIANSIGTRRVGLFAIGQ